MIRIPPSRRHSTKQKKGAKMAKRNMPVSVTLPVALMQVPHESPVGQLERSKDQDP